MWKIIYNDGKEEIITNMKEFCGGRNSMYSNLLQHRKYTKRNIVKVEEIQ